MIEIFAVLFVLLLIVLLVGAVKVNQELRADLETLLAEKPPRRSKKTFPISK
jgi:hypothetical protein